MKFNVKKVEKVATTAVDPIPPWKETKKQCL